MEYSDSYKTIESPSNEVLFKDRNSKFFAYAFPISNEDDVKDHIESLKKKHHSARHWCYAYQLGTEIIKYRANDDGEPNNSAGQPIYGQIQSFELTNVLIVVVRYFGGTKLGVGGLINAYKTAARMALEVSTIITKTINKKFVLTFDYKDMNKVMRIIKEKQLQILKQESDVQCSLEISVRKSSALQIFDHFNTTYGIKIKEL